MMGLGKLFMFYFLVDRTLYGRSKTKSRQHHPIKSSLLGSSSLKKGSYPSIAGFTVSRGYIGYLFKAEWHEIINIHRHRRSIRFHYDPGQRICRPRRADDVSLHTLPHKAIPTEDTSSPTHGYSSIDVGNLFDEAAVILAHKAD
jgi:hypothetical protein